MEQLHSVTRSFLFASCTREFCVAVWAFPSLARVPIFLPQERDVLLPLVGDTHLSRDLDETRSFPFLVGTWSFLSFHVSTLSISVFGAHLTILNAWRALSLNVLLMSLSPRVCR